MLLHNSLILLQLLLFRRKYENTGMTKFHCEKIYAAHITFNELVCRLRDDGLGDKIWCKIVATRFSKSTH